MSDRVLANWVNKVFFDYEGTMFSSIPEKPENQSHVGFMPPSCSWTLKKDPKTGKKSLHFEGKYDDNEQFNKFAGEFSSMRLDLIKNKREIPVDSWKFLPNESGVGSIVFYGFVNGVLVTIYCGDNIKNTRANPSSQTWDILNVSNLPPKMQVNADMFLAIKLEVAQTNADKTFCDLENFRSQYSANFEPWMEDHCLKLNETHRLATNIFNVSGKYSVLAGETFLLSPGEEFVFINSPEDSVFVNTVDEFTGEGSELALETQSKEEGKIQFAEFERARARRNECREVESTTKNGESAIPKRETTLEECDSAFSDFESPPTNDEGATPYLSNPFSNVCGFPEYHLETRV